MGLKKKIKLCPLCDRELHYNPELGPFCSSMNCPVWNGVAKWKRRLSTWKGTRAELIKVGLDEDVERTKFMQEEGESIKKAVNRIARERKKRYSENAGLKKRNNYFNSRNIRQVKCLRCGDIIETNVWVYQMCKCGKIAVEKRGTKTLYIGDKKDYKILPKHKV